MATSEAQRIRYGGRSPGACGCRRLRSSLQEMLRRQRQNACYNWRKANPEYYKASRRSPGVDQRVSTGCRSTRPAIWRCMVARMARRIGGCWPARASRPRKRRCHQRRRPAQELHRACPTPINGTTTTTMDTWTPLPWQIAPWEGSSPVVLLTGAGRGKSRLAAEKAARACLKYPGATGLMMRKMRQSMTNLTVLFF